MRNVIREQARNRDVVFCDRRHHAVGLCETTGADIEFHIHGNNTRASSPVDLLERSSRTGRHGQRDATLILIAYRHGLRVGELVSLRSEQIDLEQGLLYVVRSKNGTPSNHPIGGPEIRAFRKLRRDYPGSRSVFITERGAPTDRSLPRLGRHVPLPGRA